MNKVIMKGILERDVDLKYSEKGVAFSRIGISTLDAKKKKDYFNIVVFFDLAEKIATSFKKGDQIHFEGTIQNNNYEKDGKKVYQDRIILEKILEFQKQDGVVWDKTVSTDNDVDLPF
jgi:single-strand DNA-binding protein